MVGGGGGSGGGGLSRFQGYTMHGRHKALIHHIQFPEVARFRQLEGNPEQSLYRQYIYRPALTPGE